MSAATAVELRAIAERAPSIPALFFDRVLASPDREAFRFPDASDMWESRTWSHTADAVNEAAAGLIALGVAPGERVAIAASTRFDWVVADLAANSAGAATTTVYPSTIADDVVYIVADSQSRVVFAEDDAQIAKIRASRSALPDVLMVVTFDGTADGDWVISMSELAQRGRAYLADHPTAVADRVAAVTPDSLATLVYTSGATGRPKGVRLTHDAWTYQAASVSSIPGFLRADDLNFLWLPLAHVFGKILLTTQLQVGFVTAIDGRVPRISQNLAELRPTFMGSAPRIFEKTYSAVVAAQEEQGGLSLRVFRWAERIGIEHLHLRQDSKLIPLTLRVQHAIADRLVYAKVRQRFGGRIRYFVSGSAALNRDVLEWFHAMGLPVLESYGMTETAAGAFMNRPGNIKLGTVGTASPGLEVRLAEDGELHLRGPGITRGYHNLDTATAESIDEDGWLRTGDIGTIDDDGFLVLTDRKKDLFKTTGGKYVAPSRIESFFKGICPLASQMVVHGDRRNFCSALIALDSDAVRGWASAHGMADLSYEEIVSSPQMYAVVAEYVEELNLQLNRWETIKKFEILNRELTVDSGELTPSLKVKRRVVEDNNRELLNSFYF